MARRARSAAGADARFLDPCCGEGALLAALLADGAPGAAVAGIEIDASAAERARARLAPLGAGAAIVTADALSRDVRWPDGAWIVANPPWASFSGRERAAAPPPGGGHGGWPSLHGIFLQRIAEHVARHRTGAVALVPASLADLERYGPTRAAVTAHAHLAVEPVELGEAAFPGVLEPALLIELAPGPPAGGPSAAPWTAAPASELLRELALRPAFPAGAFADAGVHTGNAASRLIVPLGTPGSVGLRRGRDLTPYGLAPASIALARARPREPGLYHRIPDAAVQEAFPILLRQTASRPLAALHEPRGAFRNSLLACRGVDGLDPAFVVAVLSSPLAAAWHRARHRDARQRAFPQVKVRHLADQRLPFLTRAESPLLHDAIAERVRALARAGTEAFERERAWIESAVTDAFALSSVARAELAARADGERRPRA